MRRALILAVLLLPLARATAQDRSGELRLFVTDTSGAALPAHGILSSQATSFQLTFDIAASGEYTVKRLPLGTYRLTLEHPGFARYNSLLDIHSELPIKIAVTLDVASVSERITVTDADTLLDTTNPGNAYQLGGPTLRDWAATAPGRQAIDVVQSQPGWLLEANGVVHPRGSEYDTQYVVDGLPVLNNRSPSFSSSDDLDDVQSVKTYTSGIPAEYGRKVGGVIETVSDRNPARGLHGMVLLGGGSFNTLNGYLGTSYYDGRNVFGVSLDAGHTERFLDPPVLRNFTNTATLGGAKASFERDLTPKDRLRLSLSFDRSGFQVPNELIQQGTVASQSQLEDRANHEISGQAAYQHTFSSSVLATVQGRVRDDDATLSSNQYSTPIAALQDRGFREGYLSATVAKSFAHHELKAGADGIYSLVHEQFSYQLCPPINANCVPLDAPQSFTFHEAGDDREQAFFIQDNAHFGNVSVGAGIRSDHYSLRVNETAWSPRFGIAWNIPRVGLVFRGSYDRVFGTPAVENLLLSTSPAAQVLNREASQLPVRPSRGNYYELGVTKEVFHQAHVSANVFRRDITNFADDNNLLDTGISFPIAISAAHIYGAESQLALPKWGPFSAWLNYSYMVASAHLPAVGGLFLGDDTGELSSKDRIWVSQDQRHTAHAQLRYQPWSRFWTSAGASYNSGLPVELNGEDIQTLINQYGQSVVDRVNFPHGRVRPSLSVDFSAAADLYKKEGRSITLQADFRNLNDRLNVINFASLFSGTAIGPPRTFTLRLRFNY